MNKFLIFLGKIHFFILFIVLEIIAFSFFSKSSIYTNAVMINASNKMIGGVYAGISDVSSYFKLSDENVSLSQEISRLQNELDKYRTKFEILEESNDSLTDLVVGDSSVYTYMNARVVNSTKSKQNNFITVNKGRKDGVERDMAILQNNNIVGYILDCSENYSVGISVLNRKFMTSGRSARSYYDGSVRWNGENFGHVTMYEVLKHADIEIGDTIVTTDFSSRFPPNVGIGRIESFELINGTYYNAEVELFADFSRLINVTLVKYKNIKEKLALEDSIE